MNKETKFLTTLYQSAKSGAGNTTAVIGAVKNENLKASLTRAIEEYGEIADNAASKLYDAGEDVKKKNPIMSAMTETSAKMMANMNSSHSHIAEMMITGANMGIIELTKAQNDAPDIPEETKKLGDQFISLNRNLIADMKSYL